MPVDECLVVDSIARGLVVGRVNAIVSGSRAFHVREARPPGHLDTTYFGNVEVVRPPAEPGGGSSPCSPPPSLSMA
jgi:hypothetical protein